MSQGYVPVQWNRNKKIYDIVLWLGIVTAMAVNVAVAGASVSASLAPSDEILVLRALGDTGFILLNIILAIGPLARLNRCFLPLLYNRRHMGVSFFVIVLAHGIFALFWYHGFGVQDPITSVFTSQGTLETVSDYPFQPLGFVALLIFFLMAATSHDFWNAVLGPKFWKSLHMLVYAGYALVLLHLALGALQAEPSHVPNWVPFASLAWVGGLHLTSMFAGRADLSKVDNSAWVKISDPMAIERGVGRVVEVKGQERVAIFRTENDEFGAISNVCRHQAGPLGEGCMIDGLVTCPWHGFQYQLEDGASPPPFEEKVATYELKVENGSLLLNTTALPPGTPRPLIKLADHASEAS